MGILQPDIPVRRMANERKTKLTDALVKILRRLLTPATVTLPGLHSHCHSSTITSHSHWTLRPLYCRSLRRWKDTLPGGPAYSPQL